jgi:hypothetical protein
MSGSNLGPFPLDVWGVVLALLSRAELRAVTLVSKSLMAAARKILIRASNDICMEKRARIVYEYYFRSRPWHTAAFVLGCRSGVPYIIEYDGVKEYRLSRFDWNKSYYHCLTMLGPSWQAVCAMEDGSLAMVLGGTCYRFNYRGQQKQRLFQVPFRKVAAMCADPLDNLLLADSQSHTVKVFDQRGVLLRELGARGSGVEFRSPCSIAVLGGNRYAVSDNGLKKVFIFGLDGTLRKAISPSFEHDGAWRNEPLCALTPIAHNRWLLCGLAHCDLMDSNDELVRSCEWREHRYSTYLIALGLTGHIYTLADNNLFIYSF